jgi:ABC-2 type transport system ATP-binding protein
VVPVMKLINVEKAYGNLNVISRLSWEVPSGEVVAVVGANGTGKSTLLRIMAGYDYPTGGEVQYQGRDATRYRLHLRQEVGYLSDRPFIYPHLTAKEFLTFVTGLRQIPTEHAETLLNRFSIPPGVLISDLSYGTARKVAIASVLMHGPRLVLLDEPFNALDMLGNRALQDIMTGLKRQGCSVVVATHYLPAMEHIYDRALLLRPNAVPLELVKLPNTLLEDRVAHYILAEVTGAK